MIEELVKEADAAMNKGVETVERDLAALRTGRASAALVEGVTVPAYGGESPLNQVATVGTPDAATIAIQPWDASLTGAIEKALLAANLGMTPTNDGKTIRLNVPPLTEETRKEMVKKAHAVAEHGRVSVRNNRRHFNDEIKKDEKAHDIGEDEMKRLLDKIQKQTDAHVARIDEMMHKKEKEIMEI